MKKMAIKGLVALAAVVALCMFFSGTIKTISTAKVRLVTAKQGKLEEEIKLSGNLTFPQTEEVKLARASDPSVTIKRVRVAKGRKVAAGDVLFEAEVSGYDKEMESLRSDYEAAQKELMELERKNGDVRLKRTEEIWVEAYDALAQSKDDLMNAQTQLEVAAKLAGVTLTDGRLPEKEQDETLLEAQKAVDKAQAAQDEQQDDDTLEEDDAHGHVPVAAAHGGGDARDHGVDAQTRRAGERAVCEDAHADGHAAGARASGAGERSRIDAGAREHRGVDGNDVGHCQERCQSSAKFGPDCGLALADVK